MLGTNRLVHLTVLAVAAFAFWNGRSVDAQTQDAFHREVRQSCFRQDAIEKPSEQPLPHGRGSDWNHAFETSSQATPPNKEATSPSEPSNPGSPVPGAAVSAKPGESNKESKPQPATVIDVGGSVDWAVAGISPLAKEGWTPVKVGDKLEPATQIRTGLRSFVNLQFGATTTVSVRSITHASIAQFYRSATTENVRIDLGYGTVRGGSSEGEVRSDVIVDSPVATLAKRGTEGWEISVEPATGRFRISLAEHGLVEAIQKLSGDRTRSRLVRPGQYATDVDIANMWIKQDIFNRVVAFYSPEALSEADAEFSTYNTTGYSVLAPGGGSAVVDLSGRVSAEFVLSQTGSGFPAGATPPTLAIGLPPAVRPEGNFGTPRTFKAFVSGR